MNDDKPKKVFILISVRVDEKCNTTGFTVLGGYFLDEKKAQKELERRKISLGNLGKNIVIFELDFHE